MRSEKFKKRNQRLTQHPNISADGLHNKGGRFTHNASLQARTPGPDLLRTRLLTHRHFEWTEKESERAVVVVTLKHMYEKQYVTFCVCVCLCVCVGQG